MLGHRAMNVEDYLTILKRRWWVIAIPLVLFPIFGFLTTFLVPAQYVSTTLILIDQQKVSKDFVKPLDTEGLDSRIAYMTEQILSRSSIQPIIEKYNLYGNERLSMDARIDLFRTPAKGLEIQPIESQIARSNGLPGFKILFTASDPHTAQQVCADITGLFTRADLRANSDAAQLSTAFLSEQLQAAKHSLEDQDAKLAAFQTQHAGMLPEDQPSNVNLLGATQSQLEAATQQLSQMEQQKSYMEAMLAQQTAPPSSATATPTLEPSAEEAQLQGLLAQQADLTSRYTAENPDVIAINRKIAELRKQIAAQQAAPGPVSTLAAAPSRADSAAVQDLRARIRAFDLAIQAKRSEQQGLMQQIKTFQGRIQSSPVVEEQFKQVTRDYQNSQALYQSLLTKMNESQMTTDLENRQEGETFSVLDAPNLPTDPTFPKVSVFVIGGLFLGLGVGVLIVALLEYKDTTLRTERDVWAFTQLPTLAILAWSGEVAVASSTRPSGLKRLFSRKPSKEQFANSPG
jgi:polysaccharide chain length determinant protein (PEP-CTERM system associated)